MPRRLIVMRHAKSSWKSGASTDHQRPLNKRGRRDAPRVAQRLMDLGWAPDQVLSSDSQRTRETFEGMATVLGADRPVEFLPSLYHAGIEEVREELRPVAPETECVLVLGHNPGWEETVEWLTGEDVVMKTADAALLEGDGPTWEEAVAHPGSWRRIGYICARELE